MAGPTVTLAFAGDEKKLADSTKNVGSAVTQMSQRVESASGSMTTASSRFDKAGESADGAEGKFMGFHDVLDGVKGAFDTLSDPSASFTDKMIGLGQAGADTAGGMASFLIPAVSSLWAKIIGSTAATWLASTAQSAWTAVTSGTTIAMTFLNNAIKANPILFLVGLIVVLVTAFAALWTHSEGFRKFFIGMWNGIKTVVMAVVGGIKSAWDGVVDFFTHFPTRIGQALSGLGSLLKGIFTGALNGVINGINWALDHSINWLIHRVNDVSGLIGIPAIPDIPHIPTLHTGGIVPGDPGTMQLAVLKAGEHVTGDGGGSSGGGNVTFMGDLNSAFATMFMMLVRTGAIQVGA